MHLRLGGMALLALAGCGDRDAVRDPSGCDPGADEVCDGAGRDEDCDGLVDDDDPDRVGGVESWPDADGDGHGDLAGEAVTTCVPPAGRSPLHDDCDDAHPRVWIGAAAAEPGSACTEDADGDGYGAASPASPAAQPGDDCDDTDAAVFHGAPELFGDLVDQDCDGAAHWFFRDDFESGTVDIGVWDRQAGTVAVLDQITRHVLLVGAGSSIGTEAFDSSACESMSWSYTAMLAGVDPADAFRLQWRNGAEWNDFDRSWHDLGAYGFVTRSGFLDDPAALGPEFEIRLVVDAPVGLVYVDDFRFACAGPDGDGDGIGERDDCDDADDRHWSDCGACADADADGRGEACDLGPDCADDQPDAYPGSPDLAADGVDQDCNGYDGPSLHDGFEAGVLDTFTWDTATGWSVDAYGFPFAQEGDRTLRLVEDGEVVSQPFDASGCAAVWWSYYARGQYTTIDDSLVVSYDDGAGWVTLDELPGTGGSHGAPVRRHGMLADPAALWAGLRIRLAAPGATPAGDTSWWIDEVLVACSEPDGDLDGFPADVDCDDAAPAHWEDCGSCADADADAYGVGCDLGGDCDDADPAASPVAPDPYGDGADTSCDGHDGLALVDDFESGSPDPAVWGVLSDTEVSCAELGGEFALLLREGHRAETVPLDASACPALLWSYRGLRSTPAPGTEDLLVLSWFDGVGWVTADVWRGDGERDDEDSLRTGMVEDPLALVSGVRWALERPPGTAATAAFEVDDFTVACSAPDADGDGIAAFHDCDSASAAHWSDCGVCVDDDGDGWGPGCDLGPDCAEGDAAIYPRAPDALGDGIDADCSGSDGPGFFDGFELGFAQPAIWSTVTGVYQTRWSGAGAWALQLSGQQVLESSARDLASCDHVDWSYVAMRGPDEPEAGESLSFEWWDGAAWVLVDEVDGGVDDPGFLPRSGTVDDPAMLTTEVRIRLRADMGDDDEVHVDDLLVECVP